MHLIFKMNVYLAIIITLKHKFLMWRKSLLSCVIFNVTALLETRHFELRLIRKLETKCIAYNVHVHDVGVT